MTQTIIDSLKIFVNSKIRNFVLLLMVISSCFITLLSKYHLNDEQSINMLLNNIFQFSGIFSALLITFIISKIFQLRQEKLARLKDLITLSNKTTDFRRICKILLDEYNFWDNSMRRKLDGKYKKLSYFDLHLDNIKSNNIIKLEADYLADHHKPGAELYLAIRSLADIPVNTARLELYDDYDHNIMYPLTLIEKWYASHAANCLWYFLENKWSVYSSTFNFSAVDQTNQHQIVLLAKKINLKKYDTAVFNKELLVSIGNDFESNFFPRFYALSFYNEQGIPGSLNFLIRILLLIIIFGVLTPLWLSSIIISNISIKIVISNICIFVLSLSIIYFISQFKKILTDEVNISRENI